MQMFGGAHFRRKNPMGHSVHFNQGIFGFNIRSIHGK